MRKIALLSVLAMVAGAQAQIRITEYSTGGQIVGKGEFVEFTNMGNSAIDMTGWSFDDSSATAGLFSLSGFGVVAAHESVVMTEVTVADFRTTWGLAASVKIVGGCNQNLSSTNADGMNIYNASNTLVETLSYAANTHPTTTSRNGPLAQLGLNNDPAWVYSTVGDSYGSWTSTAGDIGNPGLYTPVPEPASMAMLGVGVLRLVRRRRATRGN